MRERPNVSTVIFGIGDNLKERAEYLDKIAALESDIRKDVDSITPALIAHNEVLGLGGALCVQTGRTYDPVIVRFTSDGKNLTAALVPSIKDRDIEWPETTEPEPESQPELLIPATAAEEVEPL